MFNVQCSYAHSLQLSVFGWFEWKLLMALCALPWSHCGNASVRYSWTVDYFTSLTILASKSTTVSPFFAPFLTHYWMDLFEYGCACLWFKCNHFICTIPCLSVTEIPNTEYHMPNAEFWIPNIEHRIPYQTQSFSPA